MSSRSDGSGTNTDNTSYSLLPFEKKTLQESRSFASKCGNRIADARRNFADKGWWGLWWDAKGFFNSSKVEEVTDYMERYEKIYEEISTFSGQVESGDTNSYERLLDIYKELEEIEKAAEEDVENNQSKAACRQLRQFLDEKYKLDHNLKKVECVVLKQTIRDVEQSCQSSKDAVNEMSGKMGKLIDENRDIKEFMETMRKENDELKLEAERNRREADEKLKKAVEDANRRSEARMQKLNETLMKKINKLLEDRNTP